MLAALRNVSLPDQGQTGHGLDGQSAPPAAQAVVAR
jgi:hypothetical protein